MITCQREIKHQNKYYFHQGHNWFVGKNYDELINKILIPKTKKLSVIVSNKQFTDGHKKRFDFVMKLKDHFKDDLDLFGRGINDIDDKWNVLAPYKYSIAIENYVCEDWITEKIYDCYLSHTFPLYYGCPNVQRYFKEDSFSLIDINDVGKTIKIIEDILSSESFYDLHLESIIEAKIHYLKNFNIFPLITNYIEGNDLKIEKLKEKEVIKPENFLTTKQSQNIISKIKSKFRKN